jgi:hypothetical protein
MKAEGMKSASTSRKQQHLGLSTRSIKSMAEKADAGKKQGTEGSSMTTIAAARLCRLYQKAKSGSESAYKTLKSMGFEGTKVDGPADDPGHGSEGREMPCVE